jgi:hypothetical protein
MWSILVFFSFSVHVYLCVIVASVAIAALFNLRVLVAEDQSLLQRMKSFLFDVFVLVVALGFSVVLLGFGNFVGNPTTIGVGRYRLNLLSFVNPGVENYGFLSNSTAFFRNRSWLSEENEGFAYLGLGVLLTVVVITFMVALRVVRLRRSHLPIIGVAVMLFLVSLSDHVAIGTRDIALPVPAFLIELRQTFRAATRFSWLAYYLLVISGWYGLTRISERMQKRAVALTLLSAVALVQIIDVGPGVLMLHKEIRDNRAEFAPTLAEEWTPLLAKYQQVSIVPSVDANEDDVDLTDEERIWFANDSLAQLAWLASVNDVRLNYSFCSRSCIQSARRSTEQVRNVLANFGPQDGSIYVFVNESEWRRVAEESGRQPLLIGGLRVVLGQVRD